MLSTLMAAVLLLGWQSTTSTSTASIDGVVIEAGTGLPIPNVRI